MVQAARSGKQNIAEGSKASVTSTETASTTATGSGRNMCPESYFNLVPKVSAALWERGGDARDGMERSLVPKLLLGHAPEGEAIASGGG